MAAGANRLGEVDSKIREGGDRCPLSESHFLSHISETALPITVSKMSHMERRLLQIITGYCCLYGAEWQDLNTLHRMPAAKGRWCLL